MIHQHGLQVFAWTVNNKKVFNRLVKLGVDGVGD